MPNSLVTVWLEIHLKLSTSTKIFCRCKNDQSLDNNEPNTNICPVCTGQPWALPQMSQEVVEKGMLIWKALNCKWNNPSRFDRKSYFYPDLPKSYQISQFDRPLCYGGKVNIELDDGTEKEVPYGQEGEIVITGPTIMAGYIHNRKETKQTLKKHKDGRTWLHTGDQGMMDKDGFVYFKGRSKRMIISSGYNIYPTNIENVIDSHPDVSMSCVIGIPHPYKVMVAKAFIVLKKPEKENAETLNSIKELVQQNLARFSWPYEYEFRKELPKTPVGKVAFNVLIHEEEMKKKERKWEQAEELLEQVEDETTSDELLDNLKVDKK